MRRGDRRTVSSRMPESFIDVLRDMEEQMNGDGVKNAVSKPKVGDRLSMVDVADILGRRMKKDIDRYVKDLEKFLESEI